MVNLLQHGLTVIDLFSGAGGTGLGFQQAGFRILAAVEKDLSAAMTYEKNLHVPVKTVDICELSPRNFRRELKLKPGELDVLVGCPPCQGFSRMRNQNGADDERNNLVIRYLEYVTEFRPRFAVFENVPGIIRTRHGRKFFQQLCNGLESLGYKLTKLEEDAADYGTPQHRVRVIVLARRNGEDPPQPVPTNGNPRSDEVHVGILKPWLTVKDAIGNRRYPSLISGERGERYGKYPNHNAPKTGQKVLGFLKQVPKNGGSREQVSKEKWLDCHKSHNGHKDVYGRLAWNRPSNTITTGCTNPSKGRFTHPEQDRALTPREAAKLQGFPDNYIFYGTRAANQIGNAVPPPLAYAIAKAIMCQALTLER